MVSFQVADLPDGKRFANSLILDKQFVVLDRELSFSSALQKNLLKWEFRTVYSEGSETPEKEKRSISLADFEPVDIDLDELNEQYEDKHDNMNYQFKKAAEQALREIPAQTEDEKMQSVQNVYNEGLNYISKLYSRYVTHNELRVSEISNTVSILIEFIRANKKYILRIQPREEDKADKNFLVNHSLRSTIYAITIAMHLNMPTQKMTELGVAAILHEIGQIKLPPQLYITDRQLSPQEKRIIATHTVLGFNILKEADFPLSIQLGVLDHHEWEDGKGYPRHLTGDKISIYGKIIAVACSYEAIIAPRHYKEARSAYEATIEMLKNSHRRYDSAVIKALVQAVSFFPIGTYVYLSNGKIGQVIESNPNDPQSPLVQILNEKNELGNLKTVMTDSDKCRIVRVVNKEELKDIFAYLK